LRLLTNLIALCSKHHLANMDRELKTYFDSKFSALKNMRELDKKRKRDHKFKYKANKKQYEFNSTLKEDLEDVLKLAREGSKHRSSKKIKEVMKEVMKDKRFKEQTY